MNIQCVLASVFYVKNMLTDPRSNTSQVGTTTIFPFNTWSTLDSGDSWMYPYQRTPMANPFLSPIGTPNCPLIDGFLIFSFPCSSSSWPQSSVPSSQKIPRAQHPGQYLARVRAAGNIQIKESPLWTYVWVSCWKWSQLVSKLVYFTYLRDVSNLLI